jgi:hypothetical protein
LARNLYSTRAMKKSTKSTALALSSETLRRLSAAELHHAAGGAGTRVCSWPASCPTMGPGCTATIF